MVSRKKISRIRFYTDKLYIFPTSIAIKKYKIDLNRECDHRDSMELTHLTFFPLPPMQDRDQD